MRKTPSSHTLIAAAIAAVLPIQGAAQAQLEEVVVTAQKRSESVQDISIAIAAFGEEQLRNLGTANLEELTEFVSGAELFDDRGAGQPTWIIRGVGLADFNSNNTPTAAIYYDDYYLSSNVLGGIGMFDMQRVEVLKGPQGGLYGRNTSGGAVLVNSRRAQPGEEINGYVTGSYGSWDRASLEAAIGGDMGESAAFRLSMLTDQGGGWQDSLATERDDEYGDRDFTALRAQLSFQPSDRFDLWLKLEGGEDKTETTLGYSRALYDGASGDFCAPAYSGRHDEDNCVTLSNLTNFLALTPGDPGVLPGRQKLDGTKVMANPINALDNQWFGANLQMNWELSFATLTSITGYLDYENNQVYDFDAQPLTLFHEDGSADLTSWSQEFRLVSNSDGPLTWLVGAMYAEDEDDEFRKGDLSDNVLVFSTATTRSFTQESESWALYGQADYQLTEAWKVHGSLRYTEEEKQLRDVDHYDTWGDFYYVQGVDKDYELDENWSGHIGLDWAFSDDAMLYGRITRGFKSGGFFGGFSFSEAELEPYAEEIVYAYEVGLKSEWLDRKLQFNAAAYFYDYQDVQGFTQELSETTGTVVTKLGNLGDAEHKGVETDIVWLPLDGLTLRASLVWMDAEIVDSDTIALSQDQVLFPIEGMQRAFAPEWSTSLEGRYEWDIGNNLRGAAQLNYSWRDDLQDEDSTFSAVDLAAFSHEDYQLLNGRISLASADDLWSVALVGRNLTDEEYWTSTSTDDLASYPSITGRPRSFAIEATFQW